MNLRYGLLAAVASFFPCPAYAVQLDCNAPNAGPDLVVGELSNFVTWGQVGSTVGYSIMKSTCNFGDTPANFFGSTSSHALFTDNLYRLHGGRFEQIGMSWVQHAYGASAESVCCTCQPPGGLETLGVGCAVTYGAAISGDQAGFGGFGGLGPRSEVNASSGAFPFPYSTQGQSGDAIYKRLQVAEEDLNPLMYAGALYFGESQTVAADDAAAGRNTNNASYRPVNVLFGPSTPNLAFFGATERGDPALLAWKAHDPNVHVSIIDVPGDGRFLCASLVQAVTPTTWRYEYAVQNLSSHRAAGRFAVPIPAGAFPSNIGFHDVDAHSGEVYDSTDWNAQVLSDRIEWTTDSFATDPNANALRFGTLYNFRFDVAAPGAIGDVSLGLFRPGAPNSILFEAYSPSPPCTVASYCQTAPNSAGPGAVITANGSLSLANDDFTLSVMGAALSEAGIFYYGPDILMVPFGDGWRCIGGATTRLFPVQGTGPSGVVSYDVDLGNPSQPAGLIEAGTTWRFQFWYRDPLFGGAGFNLSDAVSVTFCP